MSVSEFFGDLGEKIKSLRNQPSDYPNLFWVVLVFLGGAINAVAIKDFINYITPIYQQYNNATTMAKNQLGFAVIPKLATDILTIIVSAIFIFLIPIGYSFLFSRTHPEKKIIPPLFIQIVSLGLLIYFFIANIAQFTGIIYYVVMGGLVQDGIVTYASGSTVFTNDLVRHSFIVHANIDKVKGLITSKQFQRLYYLKTLKTKKEETLKLITKNRRGLSFILEIKEGLDSETIINAIFWDAGLYGIKHMGKDDYASEWALNKISLLNDYFSRRLLAKVDEGEIDNVEPLTNYIIDYFAGSISHFQEMATRKQVLLVIAILLTLASLPVFALGQIEIGALVLLAGLALFADVALHE